MAAAKVVESMEQRLWKQKSSEDISSSHPRGTSISVLKFEDLGIIK